MAKWTYNQDGDLVHPDWEHTPDGDYQPKGTKFTIDGDKILPPIDFEGLTPKQARDILEKLSR